MKYRTDKAAEVGRLIAALGTCGRVMAGLPEKVEEVGEGVEEKEGKEKEKEKEKEGEGGKVKGGKKKKGKR